MTTMRRTTTLLKNMEDLAGTMSQRHAPYLCFVAGVVDANTVSVYRQHEDSTDAFEALYIHGSTFIADDVVLVIDLGRQPIVIGTISQTDSPPTPGGTTKMAANFIIDGGGSAITTGIKGDFVIPNACTISSWTVLADQTGSIQLDVWRDSYSGAPPTGADSITGTAPPKLTSQFKAQSSALTGWTTSLNAGDVLRVNVDSATTVQRVTLELELTQGVGTGTGGGADNPAHPGFLYTIFPLASDSYKILRNDGTVIGTFTDSTSGTVTSGLLDCFNATLDHGASYFFDGAEFSFPEDPTGDCDHCRLNGLEGLIFEGRGMNQTIISNWRDDSIAGYDPTPDVEPLSFTRCNDVVIRNMEIVAGGNRDANNSSDTIDQDGSSFALIEHVKVRRSRARAIVEDGGDTGAVSQGATIQHCQIYGTPHPPMVFTGTTGSMVLQEYRYCMTWVDSLYGETPPGDYTSFVAFSSGKGIRLTFETGPMYRQTKGVTSRKIYRWSAAQPTWHLLASIDNSITQYDDNASDASIASAVAPPVNGTPTIPMEGVKLLGSRRHTVTENYIYGTGSHNVQVVRKGSDATTNKQSNAHDIGENFLGYPGLGSSTASASGVFVGGGDRVKVHDNDIRNPGNNSARGYGIYIQNQDGGTTDGTQLDGNTIIDDRDANHPHGASGMLHGIRQFVAGAAAQPINTAWGFNRITGTISTGINDGGTQSHTPSEVGHTHAGVDANLAWPRTVAGQYYSPANFVSWTTAADFTLVANHVYGGSLFFTDATLIDDMQLEFRTALSSGSKFRFLIFAADDTDGFWSTNLYESADITITGFTGFKNVNPNFTTEPQHRYWFAIVSDTNAAIRVVNPTDSTLGYSSVATTPSKINALDKAIGTSWQTGSVGPGPSAPSFTNNVPLIFGRAST